jgi:hypothetical protein
MTKDLGNVTLVSKTGKSNVEFEVEMRKPSPELEQSIEHKLSEIGWVRRVGHQELIDGGAAICFVLKRTRDTLSKIPQTIRLVSDITCSA